MNIKKITPLVLFQLFAWALNAQEVVMDFRHENGKYFNFHNIVETTDNALLVDCPMFETFGSGPDYGSMFYKISMDGQLLDSLFVPLDDIPLRTLFEPLPGMNGSYLFAHFERAGNDSTTVLNMTFIDNDLHITDEKTVLLGDFSGYAAISTSDMFIDPYGDIIASFLRNKCIHMFRIGIDGEVKLRRQLPEINYPSSLGVQVRHTGVYSRHPLRYSFLVQRVMATANDVHIMDSLFEETEVHTYGRLTNQPNTNYMPGMQEHLAEYDESSYLYASPALGVVNNHGYAALAKYDRSHNLLDFKLFDENNIDIGPIKVTAVAPDTIYYSYMTTSGRENQLVLACLDSELETRWIRYLYEPDCFHWATTMTALRDGKVAIGSYRYGHNPGRVFVTIVKDEYWNVGESPLHVRPYAFYPNPTRDRLRLQYSPDVEPASIELYDLQGRLVRSQGSGLESFNLQGLAPGQYVMKVTMADGTTFSDKVVKE